MLTKFRRLTRGYERYMTRVSRERTRQILLATADRLLEDNGFSRALLEQGALAWPWRVAEESKPLPAIDFEALNRRQSVDDLETHSGEEPAELGVSRCAIADDVTFGRNGFDKLKEPPRAA